MAFNCPPRSVTVVVMDTQVYYMSKFFVPFYTNITWNCTFLGGRGSGNLKSYKARMTLIKDHADHQDTCKVNTNIYSES